MHVPNQLKGKESKVKKTPLWTGSPLVSCSPPSKLLRSILASGIFPPFPPFLPLLTSTICLSSFSPAFNDMSKASSTSVSSAILFYSLSPLFVLSTRYMTCKFLLLTRVHRMTTLPLKNWHQHPLRPSNWSKSRGRVPQPQHCEGKNFSTRLPRSNYTPIPV